MRRSSHGRRDGWPQLRNGAHAHKEPRPPALTARSPCAPHPSGSALGRGTHGVLTRYSTRTRSEQSRLCTSSVIALGLVPPEPARPLWPPIGGACGRRCVPPRRAATSLPHRHAKARRPCSFADGGPCRAMAGFWLGRAAAAGAGRGRRCARHRRVPAPSPAPARVPPEYRQSAYSTARVPVVYPLEYSGVSSAYPHSTPKVVLRYPHRVPQSTGNVPLESLPEFPQSTPRVSLE